MDPKQLWLFPFQEIVYEPIDALINERILIVDRRNGSFTIDERKYPKEVWLRWYYGFDYSPKFEYKEHRIRMPKKDKRRLRRKFNRLEKSMDWEVMDHDCSFECFVGGHRLGGNKPNLLDQALDNVEYQTEIVRNGHLVTIKITHWEKKKYETPVPIEDTITKMISDSAFIRPNLFTDPDIVEAVTAYLQVYNEWPQVYVTEATKVGFVCFLPHRKILPIPDSKIFLWDDRIPSFILNERELEFEFQ